MAKKEQKIENGQVISYNSINYRVTNVIDQNTIIARRFDNGLKEKLKSEDVILLDQTQNFDNELISVSNSSWDRAKEKYEIIKPLISMDDRKEKDVEKCAEKNGVHSATLYRWIKLFLSTGKISALLPSPKTGGVGKSRLSDEVEEILSETIQKYYFVPDRLSIKKTYFKLQTICKEKGYKTPGINTMRARIKKASEKHHVTTRHGKKLADEKLGAHPGIYQDANVPLSVIQIDHTQLDIQIVDEKYRLTIGRPWITLAIDVFSRMVTGFVISLEKPSALSVGLCVSQSILTKENRMTELGLKCTWPVAGIPALIHVDNAKEFDGHMLERACGEYRIDIHFRPLSKPNYGAHIERYLGTLNTELHDLPGSTFSNVEKRSTYESEEKAAFTLNELEKWLTTLICDVYHKEIHSEIKTTPEAKFLEGLSGDDENPGPGSGLIPSNSDKLKLDFMPFVERTVQQNGVTVEHITYYAEVLKSWINSKDPQKSRYKRKFVFRYDPRDISKLYFFDPELKRYYQVPYSNLSAPKMTLWELRETKRYLEEKGLKNYDEDAVFQARLRLEKMEEDSKKITKQTRRNTSRKTQATKGASQSNLNTEPIKPQENVEEFSEEEILPFDDIEVY
ncbi:Mu transposase C-terminal domain-containing protein [Marinicella marina]|uniref:Mu transposase C-terminal domain-containing protein n=1 Tax=Marinicella marina TaxID=2996016 RepID=UPI0024BC620E|nr:Mu transposase C-terminal domain-containing protein [Marinicella marina]MDJ1138791.1 Mu transposase C-terminal domain-containing protein [Marinicella marina]